MYRQAKFSGMRSSGQDLLAACPQHIAGPAVLWRLSSRLCQRSCWTQQLHLRPFMLGLLRPALPLRELKPPSSASRPFMPSSPVSASSSSGGLG